MKSTLAVDDAPAPVGPYSQAQVVRLHGGQKMLWSAGQVALDPASGQLVGGDDVAAQTAQVMKNLAAVLRGAGLSFADVVKTTVFLRDMADFAAMNEVYARHFDGDPPARTTVAAAGLPRDARVEIECVAVGNDF